jgi:hypothetical protein
LPVSAVGSPPDSNCAIQAHGPDQLPWSTAGAVVVVLGARSIALPVVVAVAGGTGLAVSRIVDRAVIVFLTRSRSAHGCHPPLTVNVEVGSWDGTDLGGCERKNAPTTVPTANAGMVPSSLWIVALYPIPSGQNPVALVIRP